MRALASAGSIRRAANELCLSVKRLTRFVNVSVEARELLEKARAGLYANEIMRLTCRLAEKRRELKALSRRMKKRLAPAS